MFSSSSHRQGLRIEQIDAEAETLISYFGVEAYCEARRREREASSEAIARDWGRIARAVARKASWDRRRFAVRLSGAYVFAYVVAGLARLAVRSGRAAVALSQPRRIKNLSG